MITQEEITSAARPPRDTWIATATGSIPAPLSFFFSRLIHTCVFHFENTRCLLCVCVQLLGYLRVVLYKCRTEYNCYDRETSGEAPSYHEQFNKHDP